MEFIKELSLALEIIFMVHADLQIDPHDVIKIFLKSKQKLLNDNCVIKGLN